MLNLAATKSHWSLPKEQAQVHPGSFFVQSIVRAIAKREFSQMIGVVRPTCIREIEIRCMQFSPRQFSFLLAILPISLADELTFHVGRGSPIEGKVEWVILDCLMKTECEFSSMH